MTSMSGAQQTRICRKITNELRAEFALHDGVAGDRLEQEARMSAFISDIIVATRKGLASAPKLFSSASPYALKAVAGKKTKECCVGPIWNPNWRDSDLDSWLPGDQPNSDAGVVTVLTPMKDWTFAEAAVSVLNDVSPDTPVETLARLLKERRHTMTLAQVEAMAEATERGEKTGMVVNGYGNFAFVENEDGSVSVVNVRRRGDDRPWRASVYELAYDNRWHAGGRLMVCNLDPRILGL